MLPESVLSVKTAASSFALVDLTTLKADLGIADSSQDARLTRIVAAISQQVPAYIGRPIAEQEYIETWRLPAGGQDYWSVTLPRDQINFLDLSRTPVTIVETVVEAGVTLDPSLYQWIDDKGLMRLTAAGGVTGWASGTIAVTYKAGWLPTGTPTPPQIALPADLYEASLLAARGMFYAKDRDPTQLVRSEIVPDVYSVTYDTRTGYGGDPAGVGNYGLPPAVTAMLDAYRRAPFMF